MNYQVIIIVSLLKKKVLSIQRKRKHTRTSMMHELEKRRARNTLKCL
jgi:hypothetical protein